LRMMEFEDLKMNSKSIAKVNSKQREALKRKIPL
jgi:hypothetical protein